MAIKKSSQLSLISSKTSLCFGGSLLKGNAKTRRPLSTKSAVHLVLKSAVAVGSQSMLQRRNSQKIDRVMRYHAKLCGVRIYHLVNVGNHLHLVVRIQSSKLFAKYLRVCCGIIARHVMQKERGASGESKAFEGSRTGFWVARPFTRVVRWGRDYQNVASYMDKNRFQVARSYFVAWGFDEVDPRKIQLLNTG